MAVAVVKTSGQPFYSSFRYESNLFCMAREAGIGIIMQGCGHKSNDSMALTMT